MRLPLYELLGDIKQRRLTIPPASVVIGKHQRQAQRVGRPVTQEEFAEAIGVSPEWYCALENSKCSEASPALIRKIAIALHDRRAERQMQMGEDAIIAKLAELPGYLKRISSASSYRDAAVEAMATGAKLLSPTCVAIVTSNVPTVSHRARLSARRHNFGVRYATA
jgi:transcriptional regulator with XRE-family HTH domain